MKLENLKFTEETKRLIDLYQVNIIITENVTIANCFNIWHIKNGNKLFLGYGFF